MGQRSREGEAQVVTGDGRRKCVRARLRPVGRFPYRQRRVNPVVITINSPSPSLRRGVRTQRAPRLDRAWVVGDTGRLLHAYPYVEREDAVATTCKPVEERDIRRTRHYGVLRRRLNPVCPPGRLSMTGETRHRRENW